MNLKSVAASILSEIIKVDESLFEIPPDRKLGDVAFPCFALSKELKKSPQVIASELAQKLTLQIPIKEIKAIGPYVNFFAETSLIAEQILTRIAKEKDDYGKQEQEKQKSVVIDFSSPNIAKSFGIAHIRSTVIGNSLSRMHKFLGYNVQRVNHLGDWGTQFGKLIVAYLKWGDDNELEEKGIAHLVSIYIKFGEEAKIDPTLDDQGREWFSKLEKGDTQAVKLWELFRKISMEEFKRYYSILDIHFDHYLGESFYGDYIESTTDEITKKTKTEISEGALIVNLEKYDMSPVILRKKDGSSIYHIRDLAAALYRLKKFDPQKIIYVVDKRQKLHFKQVFKVLELIGEDPTRFIHVDFGMMSYEGSAMSTREGNFVLLEEVLDKAIEIAFNIICEKNPELTSKKQVSEMVGIGAVVFGDLSNDRVLDVDFRWDKVLDFEGDTAPYIQYTHARICSIIRKNENKVPLKVDFSLLKDESEKELVHKLGEFGNVVETAANAYKPSILCRYMLDLSHDFNKFYAACQILKEEEELKNARILLIDCVRQTLENGLYLLGIKAPKEM